VDGGAVAQAEAGWEEPDVEEIWELTELIELGE
jgi:hypothetical protein